MRLPCDLYWTGGAFRVSLKHWLDLSPSVENDAIAIVEKFRLACQRQYIAFNGMVNGRNLAYENFRKLFDPAHLDKTIWIGNDDPNSNRQMPGRSTIAWMVKREFLEGLKSEGEFEQQHAKALVVFIYHLWEENYRKELSQCLSVRSNQVQCILMGDIRHVRGSFITTC